MRLPRELTFGAALSRSDRNKNTCSAKDGYNNICMKHTSFPIGDEHKESGNRMFWLIKNELANWKYDN